MPGWPGSSSLRTRLTPRPGATYHSRMMNKVTASALMLLVATTASAASVVARWDPVTLDVEGHPESVSHYMLYYGETARPAGVTHPGDGTFGYDHTVNVGDMTEVRCEDLIAGRTYYFAVAAVDTSGNLSAYSDEVGVDVPGDEDGGPADGDGPDAGPADAGTQRADETTGRVEGGCGCRGSSPASSGGAVLILLWLAGPGRARRRRRMPG